MKRSLGTIVLFALLILTIVALTQIDTGDTSAQSTVSRTN
jgi:hypothetical protein